MEACESEPSVAITLNTLKLHNVEDNRKVVNENKVAFTVDPAPQAVNEENETEENDDNSSEDSDDTKQGRSHHSSASTESLFARRKCSREKLGRIFLPPDEQDEDSGSQLSPAVQYNISLSTKNSNFLEPPPTPSVADVVQLRYNLSAEMIKEKSENEFNFVIPLPKVNRVNIDDSVSDAISKASSELKNSVTPLKYHLASICTIGKGSFGRVYLTRHRITGRYYALKAMHIPAIIAKRQVEHVHNEKNILLKLKHPFIVNLYDIAKDRKYLYMILEYLSGGELFSYLRMSRHFSSPVVKFYAAEVILALEYLHSLNIAYRDLKPENLMLTDDGHIKLTDFGFAKKIGNKSYTFCGTSEYLAPEVISRKGHSLDVDHWSLGVLIFELMVGRPPFRGSDAEEVLKEILRQSEQLEWPRHTFSLNAKHLIKRLLTIDAKNRLGHKSSAEIKEHAWFENCDWNAIHNKVIRPPLIPTIYFEGDTGNFDSYDETDELQPAQQRELDLFDDW